MALVQPKVGNETQGGDGGDTFTINDTLIPVREIKVWIAKGAGDWTDRDLVKAIEVELTDGTKRAYGNKKGTSYSFKFDEGEKVTSLDLYTGARVDRIMLKTSSRTWDHGGKGGTAHHQDVGNGILLGFDGSADSNELISLGAIFKESSD